MNVHTQDIEIDLLLDAMAEKYGYDFRNYARASVKRRIHHRMALSGLRTISEMRERMLDDQNFFLAMLGDFSINVTEMFRDASFYLAFRKEVVPRLMVYPFIRIWIAGCATGEEVYSMAIALHEEGLYERTRIYATDINENALQKAGEGIYSIKEIKEYTFNYQKAGGRKSFSNYYTAHYNAAMMAPFLRKNIVFSNHNLVSDARFNEMHLISCRNVMIYFNKKLRDRVLGLFHESLCHAGILCLGNKESIRFTRYTDDFEPVVENEKIYRKKGNYRTTL
ncbi:MAG: protein-glutamate O-methyltransferase CheR [Desulfobulbaceae bacterium]|nr:protein-glutamate O-methyltransferase CheR [Desulfobulbaceae bacterium]